MRRLTGRKQTIRKTLFVRMCISYLLLLALPLLFISAKLLPEAENNALQSVIETRKSNLLRYQATVDMYLQSLQSDALKISFSGNLTPYALSKGEMSTLTAIEEMQKLVSLEGFITTAMYYNKANDRFYTRLASFSLSSMLPSAGAPFYPNWKPEEILETLLSLRSPTTRAVEPINIYKGDRYIHALSFLIPIPVNGSSFYGVLIYQIEQETFQKLWLPDAAADESVFICDNDGQLLCQIAGTSDRPGAQADAFFFENAKNNILRIDGDEYICVYEKSSNSSWRYVSLCATSAAMSGVRKTMNTLWFVTGMLVIIGGLSAAASIYNYYKPINRLVKKLLPTEKTCTGNELDYVSNALDRLHHQTDHLHKQLLNTAPMLSEYIVYSLLGGQYENLAAFRAAASGTELDFPYPCSRVAIVWDEMLEISEVVQLWDDYFLKAASETRFFCLPSFDQRSLLIICNYAEAVDIESLLRKEYEQLYPEDSLMIVGPVCNRIEQVSLSYEAAVEQLERCIFLEEFGIQYVKQKPPSGIELPFPLMYALDFAIVNMKPVDIEKSMKELLEFLRTSDASVQQLRIWYMSIQVMLLRGYKKLRIDCPLPHETLNRSDTATFSEIKDNLELLSYQLCENLSATLNDNRVIDIEDVTAYIRQHALESDFSIQQVADTFNMSLSAFSHYFKRRTGAVCKLYVDTYRVNLAIAYLKDTHEPLETIAQRFGFINASSFIRTCKKITGRTPGYYREM